MRILKYPQFRVCTCERCGTVFQVEPYDCLEYRFYSLGEYDVFVRCPTCDKYCEVTEIKNAADTDVGHKKEE